LEHRLSLHRSVQKIHWSPPDIFSAYRDVPRVATYHFALRATTSPVRNV